MKTFKTMLFISLTVFLFASCDSSTTPAPDNVPGDDTYTEIEDDVSWVAMSNLTRPSLMKSARLTPSLILTQLSST